MAYIATWLYITFRIKDLQTLQILCWFTAFYPCLHQDMFRSIPDAVKFDLSEGEDGMKFKDPVFYKSQKNKTRFKKTASLQSCRIAPWMKRLAHFWKTKKLPTLAPQLFFFFFLSFFKCCLLQMQT